MLLAVCRYVLTSLCLSAFAAQASSQPLKLLTSIDSPSTLSLEILPRSLHTSNLPSRSIPLDSSTVLHSDRIRITLSAFSRTFHLHLRPNDDLIHPAARISHYSVSPDTGLPTLVKTEPLMKHSVLAFTGEVVHADRSDTRLREDTAGLLRPSDHLGTLGWARIVVHNQGDTTSATEPLYEGAFSYLGDVYHIMTMDRYLRTKSIQDPHTQHIQSDAPSQMVIFRDSDLAVSNPFGAYDQTQAPSMCGHDDLSYNSDAHQNPILRASSSSQTLRDNPWRIFEDQKRTWNSLVGKRDDVAGGDVNSNFANSIGLTAGCPNTPKILYMGVAADCEYTLQHGSVENATSTIISNWNTASALYKTSFNVSLGILHIEVHNATCPKVTDSVRPWNIPCGNVTLNDRLSLFSEYRGTMGNDGAGLWHLMSGCPTGTEVGVAWLGTLCNQQASGQTGSVVSGTAVSTAGRSEWQVVAHEIGHNFGAIHDCQSGCNSTSGCCPLSTTTCDADSKFIMSPVTSLGEMNFSPCSIGNICSVMQEGVKDSVNATCLQDPDANTKTITLQMCGNGIVETGEDCDPGFNQSSPCCNSATCKFTANAVCDPVSDTCCTDSCQLSPTTQVCRPAISGGCDIAEMCTGTSATCPSDKFQPDGMSCGSSGLACASGHCTSISQQCATVGMSMNLTTACPNQSSQSCQISCQNPLDSNSCVVLQSQLIDGSPCGYGGSCVSGNCVAGPLLDTVKAWYVRNLQISIPVTVVVCIVALLLIWVLIIAIRRCLNPKKAPSSRVQRLSSRPSLSNSSGLDLLQYSLQPNVSLAPTVLPPVLRPGSSVPFNQAPTRIPWTESDRRLRKTGLGRSEDLAEPRRSNWVDPAPWNGSP